MELSEFEIHKKIYEENRDAIIILAKRSDYIIDGCNQAALDMLGFTRDELVKKSVRIICLDDDEVEKCGASREKSLKLKKKDGSILYSEQSIIPLTAKSGNDIGCVLILKDLEGFYYNSMSEPKLSHKARSLRQLNHNLQKIREDEKKFMTRQLLDVRAQIWTGLRFEVCELLKIVNKSEFKELKSDIVSKLEEMDKTINSLIKTGRELSASIRPTIIDNLGLPSAIRWYAAKYQDETNIICDTKSVSDSYFPGKDSSIIIFRICEQILNNVKEHSSATRVDIILNAEKDDLNLLIIDNGIGITRAKIENPESFGLLRIKERAKCLGGTASIKGGKGAGTAVSIKLPVKNLGL